MTSTDVAEHDDDGAPLRSDVTPPPARAWERASKRAALACLLAVAAYYLLLPRRPSGGRGVAVDSWRAWASAAGLALAVALAWSAWRAHRRYSVLARAGLAGSRERFAYVWALARSVGFVGAVAAEGATGLPVGRGFAIALAAAGGLLAWDALRERAARRGVVGAVAIASAALGAIGPADRATAGLGAASIVVALAALAYAATTRDLWPAPASVRSTWRERAAGA